MTTQAEAGFKKSFVSAYLPWIIAAAAAGVYLLTLNQWLSFKSLGTYARATRQTWTPEVFSPLFTLVTSLFHWLPETTVPLAMNLFSAVCAVLVLALLARSVALLPHDRTLKQREREQSPFALLSLRESWIPPVLAVLVCGLQLTFWENATSLSRGMFDLLLFAYSVRCLLEYRISISGQDSWLWRAALVYAAGTTDNWVMMGLFPGFLAAMIWIKGLRFFDLRFLSGLFLCFLGGLLVYAYLPLLHMRSDGLFWLALKANVSAEFSQVVYICRYTPHHVQFLLVFTSLLPILVIGIRWKSYFGDTSEVGILLTTWIFHLTHIALLGVCIWAAFDTGFSLRDAEGKFPMLTGNRDAFLPLYFLSALSIGYLSGYLLLVFKPLVQRMRRASTPEKVLRGASMAVICGLLVLAPAGLLYKNIPLIKASNGPAVKTYASLMAENLPPNGVILSDNWGSLLLTQAWLARSGKAANFVFLETHALKVPVFHRFEKAKHPTIWPPLTTNMYRDDFRFTDAALTDLLMRLAEKNPIYYLHPSFGAFFENFYQVPHGLVYEMKQFATNTVLSAPPLSEAIFAENESFWKKHDDEIRTLLPSITAPVSDKDPDFRRRWGQKMHIPFGQDSTAVELGNIYSRALNTWGVRAQQIGRLEIAGKHFEEATQLYPENVVAGANLEFNRKLRAGEHVAVDDPAEFEARFGKFRGWEQTLNLNGIFDEPTGCLAQGIVFARGNLNRQAAQNFERSLTLAPESLLARFWLARVYVLSHTPEKALSLIEELKARGDQLSDAAISSSDIFQVELAANYASKEPDKVEHLLASALSRNPPNIGLLDTATRVSMSFNDYTNALRLQDRQLELSPDDVTRLINKGFIEVRLGNFSAAVPPLSKALSFQPTNSLALFYRATANFQSEKLDDAQHDYELLQKLNPKAYPIYGNLGEVAFHKKDTNAAIRYYELYLTNAIPNSPDANRAMDRLRSLKTGSP